MLTNDNMQIGFECKVLSGFNEFENYTYLIATMRANTDSDITILILR